MKATGIMVNDILYSNKYNEPFKVFEIRNYGVTTMWFNTACLRYDEIEPIPLNKEILKKFGFSIKEGGYIMGLAIEDTFTMNLEQRTKNAV